MRGSWRRGQAGPSPRSKTRSHHKRAGVLYAIAPCCAPQIVQPSVDWAGQVFCLLEQGRRGGHTDAMPRSRRSWPSMIRRLLFDLLTLAGFAVRSRTQLAAENLFLRKQLALYQERGVKPRRPDPATRVVLVLLSRLLDWRALLTVVQPDTLIRWHRQGWRLLWRWKSRPGRPPIPRTCSDSS